MKIITHRPIDKKVSVKKPEVKKAPVKKETNTYLSDKDN